MKKYLINKPPSDLKLEKVFQKIGLEIAQIIKFLPISPNQVTLLKIPIGASFFYFTFIEKFYLAGLTIILWKILDKVDGALARITKRSSDFGAWLDMLLDRIFWSVMLFAIALTSYRDTKSIIIWILLASILFLNLIFQNLFSLNVNFSKRFNLSDQKRTFKKSLKSHFKINLFYEAIFSFYYLFEEFVALALILYLPIKNILPINTVTIILYAYATFFAISTAIVVYNQAKILFRAKKPRHSCRG